MNRRQLLRAGALTFPGVALSGSLIQPISSLAQVADPDQDDSARFGSLPDELIRPVTVPNKPMPKGLMQPLNVEGFRGGDKQEGLNRARVPASSFVYATERGEPLKDSDHLNQFYVFQNQMVGGKPFVYDASTVEPKLETPSTMPDVAMTVKMEAFHLAESEDVKPDSRATLRLTVGNQPDVSETQETLFWAITTGLKLWDDAKKKPTESKDLQSDFKRALSNRYIELPGGLGSLKFEVIKHKEPSWWSKALKFANSDGLTNVLTSVIGFPAVTKSAIAFIDEAVSRFENTKPEVLFKSRPMPLAFSKQAKETYEGDTTAKIGALNAGIWIIARGKDFSTLADKNAWFYTTNGILIPGNVTPAQMLQKDFKFEDPFKNVTYAVLRSKVEPTKLAIFGGAS